jgi:hypothetical protein
MRFLPLASALLITCLGAGLDCRDAQAQEMLAAFDFPHSGGSLRLRTAPCADARIVRLYGDDVPDPYLTGVLELQGRVLTGCWYQADGRVFFTDSEGDLLVPPPQVDRFRSPDRLQRFDREAILHTYIR